MKTITFTLLFFILPVLLFSQATFQKTFTITGDDDGISVIQTSDGNYLVYGISNILDDSIHFLLKTDPNGDSLWVHRYVGNYCDWGFPVLNLALPALNKVLIATKDHGYLFLSREKHGILDTTFIIKTDEDGNISSTAKFAWLRSSAIQQAVDGCFILCGIDSTHRAIIIKTDSSGQELWRKWISDFLEGDLGWATKGAVVNSVTSTTDGGYMVGGITETMPWKPQNPAESSTSDKTEERFISDGNPSLMSMLVFYGTFLIKVNHNGDTLWSKKIHYFPLQEFYDLQTISDNGFVAVGLMDSLSNDYPQHMNGIIMRFDEDGDSIWTKNYGGPGYQEFNSLEKTDDGGYIACGASKPHLINPQPFYGFYLVRMDADGDTLWTKYYPGGLAGGHDIFGCSVHQTSDHGFIACGIQFDSNDHGHVYLIKTDGLGNVYPQGVDNKQPSACIFPFPNPTRGMVFMNLPEKYNTLEISDLLGNVILRKNIDPENNSTLKIDLSGNPVGIYLVKLKNESGVRVGKIILAN